MGRLVAQGGLFTAGVVSGTMHRLWLITFYTRFGDLFPRGGVAGAAGLLLLARRAR